MPDPRTTVEQFAREHRLFRRVDKLVVAVSGGPDSVAALLLLRDLRETFGYELVAAHFDHMLRPESGRELEFVRELCGSLDIRCLTGEGNVREAAERSGGGIEETAREMRYQFLAFLAGKELAPAIATGHTADDQAETILMHVIRGTGVRGLRGMLPRSPVPGSEAHQLVRPLLALTRADTLEVCRAAGVTPVLDPSNEDPAFLRNRIRHELMPALRSLNPSVDDALLGLADSARELFDEVERRSMTVQPATRDAIGSVFETAAVAALPTEGIALIIEREALFSRLAFEVNRTRLANLRDVLTSGSGEVTFGETIVEASSGRLRIGPQLSYDEIEPRMLNIPGITVAGPWRIEVATDGLDAGPGQAVAVVSLSALKGALRVRSPQPGDRVTPMEGAPKLSDVFINAKVPRWERQGVAVIADSEGVLGASAPLPGLPYVPDDDAIWVRFSHT
jgi:tRNA(Ile)-lysidine synthase